MVSFNTDVIVDSTSTPFWRFEITSVNDVILPWTIPDFPVVTINFKEVTFKQRDKNAAGLINSVETIVAKKYTCKKHCTITLQANNKYTVL